MYTPTVSVCIPVYNEEHNIKSLVISLLGQKQNDIVLTEIFVACDGCTDNTVNVLREIEDTRLFIMESPVREGRAVRQNEMMTKATGDITVLIDADVEVHDPRMLEHLTRPIREHGAHLTSAALVPLPSRTFFEEVLSFSMRMKQIVFSLWNNGQNVYLCHGPIRAFSRNLAEKIHFPYSDGEDMYSYLYCMIHGYTFQFTAETFVFYHLPAHIRDHEKQSRRFIYSKDLYKKEFLKKDTMRYLHIPLSVYVQAVIRSFPFIMRHLHLFLLYICVFSYICIKNMYFGSMSNTWNVETSKKHE